MSIKINLYMQPMSHIKSYFEMVDLAKKYDIEYLEILNQFEFETPDIEFAKRLRKYADERGIKFVCVSVGANLIGEDSKEKIEYVKKYADVCAILGSPLLHHTIAIEFQNPEKVFGEKEKNFNKGILAAREIYDYAEKLGVRTIHEEQGFLFNGIEGYQNLVDNIDRNTGTLLDFGNIRFRDDDILEFAEKFKCRIAHVHANDYKVYGSEIPEGNYYTSYNKSNFKEAKFGEGDNDFYGIIKFLKKIGYSGYCAIELSPIGPDEEKTFREDLEYLRKVIKEA